MWENEWGGNRESARALSMLLKIDPKWRRESQGRGASWSLQKVRQECQEFWGQVLHVGSVDSQVLSFFLSWPGLVTAGNCPCESHNLGANALMWTWDFSSLRAFGPLQLKLWEVCTHGLCEQVLRIQIWNGMDNACFLWRSLLRLHPFPLINSLCENPLQRCKSKHFTQCLLVYRNVFTSCFPTVSILGLSLCLAFLELSIFDFQIPYCYFFFC